MQLKTLILPTIITLVLLTAFQAVNPFILGADLTKVPSWAVTIFAAVQHFFAVTPWAIALGFAWAFFGWLRQNIGNADIEFESEKLYTTFVWYEGLIIVLATGLSPAMASAIAAIIMAVKSVLNATKEG